MTVNEALEKLDQAGQLEDEVRAAFPCPECGGLGQLYPGGCWHPCCECHGTGIRADLSFPEEEVADGQ